MNNLAAHNFYEHCKLRAKERYNYVLTRPDFDTISLNIRKRNRPGIDLPLFKDITAQRNQHWIVQHNKIWFYVVYDTFVKFCITFMPMEDLPKKQLQLNIPTITLLKQRGIWPH